jgi:hypothetical protein
MTLALRVFGSAADELARSRGFSGLPNFADHPLDQLSAQCIARPPLSSFNTQKATTS